MKESINSKATIQVGVTAVKMKSFGENLKALMLRDRLAVNDVAKAIGEPLKTVQEWVGRGRTPRNLDSILKLALFFRVSTHFLLSGKEDPRASVGALLEAAELHVGLYEISIKKVTENKKAA